MENYEYGLSPWYENGEAEKPAISVVDSYWINGFSFFSSALFNISSILEIDSVLEKSNLSTKTTSSLSFNSSALELNLIL